MISDFAEHTAPLISFHIFPIMLNMKRSVATGEASEPLGASIATLRRRAATGKVIPERAAAGHRRYGLTKLQPEVFHTDPCERRTVAYAPVSSRGQKEDLERQQHMLELYCARQGWTFEVIADLGSSMNHHKKGLKRLLNDLVEGRIGRLVITHQDRCCGSGRNWSLPSVR